MLRLKVIAASLLVAVRRLHVQVARGPRKRGVRRAYPGCRRAQGAHLDDHVLFTVYQRGWQAHVGFNPSGACMPIAIPASIAKHSWARTTSRMPSKLPMFALAARSQSTSRKRRPCSRLRPQNFDARGPFAWVGEAIRDRMVAKVLPVKAISMQGKKEVDKIRANVVRAMIDEGSALGDLRRDFLFDETTKRLVGIWLPNEKNLEFETAVDRTHPAEEKSSMFRPVACLEHEIVLDPKLDERDFSLDAPAGYALEKQAKATVTESEIAAYLGAAVKFNDGVFPDSPFEAFDPARFNKVSEKTTDEQTPAEQEMIEQHSKFLLREIYRPPFRQFVDDQTASGSFRYVGAGARIGNAGQIICWFTPRGATKPRAIFGDLSIRDVNTSDLPFDPSH